MTARALVVIGGGEHARVVIDAARAGGSWTVVGVVDEGPAVRTCSLFGIEHLGDDRGYLASRAALPPAERPWLVLGVGGLLDLATRRRLAAAYDAVDAGRWATVIHPAAWLSPVAQVAPGAVVLAAAVINAGASVGPHAIVNTGAIVEHDAEVGAFGHVGPRAVLGGGAILGEAAFLGMGAVVRDHVRVGPGATVGMGAVVVASIDGGAVVVGSPARPARGMEVPR